MKGKLVVTAGLGGMGGAQPLAVTMNEGVVICVEVDQARIKRRLDTRYLDTMTDDIQTALNMARQAADEKSAPCPSGFWVTRPRCSRLLAQQGVTPDVVTDQTSSHDELNGYVPAGIHL